MQRKQSWAMRNCQVTAADLRDQARVLLSLHPQWTDARTERKIEREKQSASAVTSIKTCVPGEQQCAAAPAISTGVMQLKLHQKQSYLKALPCLVAVRGSLINKPQVQVFSIFRACLIFNCCLRSGSNHRAEQLGKQTTRRSSDSNRKHKRVQ